MKYAKRCARCRVTKQVSDFRMNRSESDGRQRYCKPCQVEVNRISRLKNYEVYRALHTRYRERYAEQERQRSALHKRRNREKVLAHKTVYRAVKSGRLVRPEVCDRCGSAASRIEAHHENYAERLKVIWLCSPCHAQRHKEIDEALRLEEAA